MVYVFKRPFWRIDSRVKTELQKGKSGGGEIRQKVLQLSRGHDDSWDSRAEVSVFTTVFWRQSLQDILKFLMVGSRNNHAK